MSLEDKAKFIIETERLIVTEYHIAKKHTGNGYAAEAVRAFLPVIARQVNIRKIYGICSAENKASLAVMRKCGFQNVSAEIGLYQGTEREIIKNVWIT